MSSLLLALAVSGTVVDTHSHWTSDGSRIVTEVTIDTPSGPMVVSQLGGTVDGETMRTFPGPEIMEPGMMVAVDVHDDMDLARQMHTVVDDLKVLAYPDGFVRTGPTKAGHYLYWESGCIFMTVDDAGTREVAGDAEFPVIDASIKTWNDDTASCSYMVMMNAGRKAMEVGKDHVNVIKFRDESWCRPAVDNDPARCYDPSAAGITTATYVDDASSSRDGAIVDADVEINGHDFAIAVDGVSLGTASCQAELGNTLTHELGHVHGLEHTCLASGDPMRLDGSGNKVPTCSSSLGNPAITEPTMYNFQDCGETKKETLEADDINAICTIYPTAKDPKTCEPVGSSTGCGCQSSGPAAPAVLVGVVLLGLGRRRR